MYEKLKRNYAMQFNLNHSVIFVARGSAIEAKRILVTIQTKHVTFASGSVSMNATHIEKGCGQEWLEPWRHQHCVLLQEIDNKITRKKEKETRIL